MADYRVHLAKTLKTGQNQVHRSEIQELASENARRCSERPLTACERPLTASVKIFGFFVSLVLGPGPGPNPSMFALSLIHI